MKPLNSSLPALAAAVLVALVLADGAAAQDWSWWPGPTPPDTRDAMMKARNVPRPTAQQLKQIESLAPDKPVVAPRQPRRVLVWGRLWTHAGNAFFEESMRIIAKKSAAFEVVAGDDPRLLLPESLKDFDAIFWNSLHDGSPFLPGNMRNLPADAQAEARKLDQAIKASILKFVMEDGRGIGGIVGSIASHGREWPAYGEMMGAVYGGHYGTNMVIQIEDPTSPLVAGLGGKPWEITTHNAYLPAGPYSRDRLRVLLSLDMTRTPNPAEQQGQEWLRERVASLKGDFPICWVRQHGKGRVFYVAIGYNSREYFEPRFLDLLLRATQFMTGDLEADMTPSGAASAPAAK